MEKNNLTPVKSVLISLFHKEPATELIQTLAQSGVTIYSTGGTLNFIRDMGWEAIPVEELTKYPSVFGGRVKTLHPKVFGGILHRRDNQSDLNELSLHGIPPIDMVIVDLYPFEKTVESGAEENEIIEKIDIGGISLIRAAAKNFQFTWVVASSDLYPAATEILRNQDNATHLSQRKEFAAHAFNVSSHYDTAIHDYLAPDNQSSFKKSIQEHKELRYGENPHQKGFFYGDLNQVFTQLHGKELSYNNLLDIDGAVALISEFDEPTFAIIKHTNACGLATRQNIRDAYRDALASDPISAFGGILIANRNIDRDTAYDINELFFEVILAPDYENEALQVLKQKKNRIILKLNNLNQQNWHFRSALNGVLAQSANTKQTPQENWSIATESAPDNNTAEDLLFANKIVKHTKSNAIVLAANKQLLASGTGQTSRVDALKQAIVKAREFNHPLKGAVMASDAFFPFADCVEIAHKEGINAVIQPGGSVRDKESTDFCNEHAMIMIMTGTRHFKH
ncbi:MAG: bifunctional phosphoribosylaminoimidazolecarboxamide formyltransferase/IMP cyclohydrolase PurH [Bacteroidetes bacterium]|nr:MAG: bifunctional phosphoribosylaminoimidazolecarboxamide formyltransferase/IMP cyclohydrolase PurH [Bacteroidota bacterium]